MALFRPLGHVGIALATALASWLHAALFWLTLRNRGFLAVDARLRSRLPRIAIASAVMAAALLLAAGALHGHLAAAAAGPRVAALTALIVGGLAVFAVSAQLTGAASLRDLSAMLRRRD